MNFSWTSLTLAQRQALSALCQKGPSSLSSELAEQLINLGLAERFAGSTYRASPLGSTLPPTMSAH